MMQSILDWLTSLSHQVPLETFTIVGSFLEEVIAPIPSPLVLTTAGSLTAANGLPWASLLWINLLAMLAKTAGALLVYGIAWWGGEFFIRRFGKFFKVSMEDIEKINAMLGKRRSKFWSLFALRALPIVPSSPIAFLCGLIHFPFRTYLIATILGTYIRNMFFLILGYVGVGAYTSILNGVESTETILNIVIGVIVLGFIAWFYYKRSKAMSSGQKTSAGPNQL